MFLFLPVICQSHTNLLHGLTHFWRVISERIRNRKMNLHFKIQRHLSEILCRSSSAHAKLSGHFPCFYTKWFVPLFHCFPLPDPLEEPSKEQEDLLLPATGFLENLPYPARVNLQTLRGPAWKGRDEASSGTRRSFQKWLSDCRKSWENEDWITCWPTD